MRMPHPTPTSQPLPFESDRAPVPPPDLPLEPAMAMTPAAIAAFDALVHELHPDAARVDATRLQRLAAWLSAMPREQARTVVDQRLQRLQELRAMLADPDWDCDPPVRARLDKLLAYVDQGEDLIPDRIPLLGLLDDVLLIELAWPAFAEEAEDYRDFCAYREVRAPAGNGAELRAAWVRERLDEIALLQQRVRIHEHHYAPVFHAAESPFRVT
ncbi:DUF1232 domain-containing protein [Lysobacter sp. 5GHs7-4]|uniref:DUF1232 domain-containing protein n=1 Tax=Lysobacter sp. 5GHs7-4 TaxID=2904253 RepID=UPI001E5A95DC|nr:DUF1232 domain-containing protein [Lysobacter sp. 5GHs7-4]UHQ22016.1 DUF1232 domain-containing protein [Lysobacter sp. 5GHs7-4]